MSASQLKSSNLFKPFSISKNVTLNHRIVHAPTTRLRATEDYVPSDLQLQYYDDRSKIPGTLLITEATYISADSIGIPHVPGIWSDQQVQAWKKIADKVHENHSYLSIQIWALGREADPAVLASKNVKYVSPMDDIYPDDIKKNSAIENNNPLKALTIPEIKQWVQKFVQAAENAVKAGIDIIELHSAHGFLIDQFFQEITNKRSDIYGGSIENRARFLLEIVDAVIEKIGDASKLALRLAPWAKTSGMNGITDDSATYQAYVYVLSELQKRSDNGHTLAYISIVEPRVSGLDDVDDPDIYKLKSNDFIYTHWKGTVLRAGGYLRDAPDYGWLLKHVNQDNRTLIGVGRHFLSNPDLVDRLKNGWELTDYDRSTFYIPAINKGYNNWPLYNTTKIVDESVENQIAVALA
ncbi:alkene reductase [Ascoidea rubescens DSM 1968]|uniref:NAPDH dehydrogenase n=1 Tax=Ascoidea rubescens DSM 1968 TaxID=1344418 RepID=A0A1D2VAX4_9ASCO|nr:NAPDH dehydrogenase [Ascoidea rubescens DSM 1968]ODV58751.1 NAPDH dehydrogenase [Ascoidea rubescens DSM 1968]